MNANINETRGFYKLSWVQRIGFGSGDLAQNLIYQTVSTYLAIFYTNVFGLSAGAAAAMILVVRLIDVLWDPFVGAFVDKRSPKLGKYRTYLIFGGIPLTVFAILCYWNGLVGLENSFSFNVFGLKFALSHKLLYAYVTYVGLSMCYTLVNVPYGALNASLTRDTDEITKLTSVRMLMANIGGFAVQFGVPAFIQYLAPNHDWKQASAADAWFTVLLIFAVAGLVLLVFCFTQTKERVVMESSKTESVHYADLFKEFIYNRPLRVLAFFFITAFAMMAIGNTASSYYLGYNIGRDDIVPWFNGLGSIPAFIFLPMVPAIKRAIGKKQMFYVFLSIAIIGMAMLYVITVIPALKSQIWLICVAQFIKSTGVIVATGYMWALVPEVISYGERKTGKRISGVVNALTGIFFKAGFALGGAIPLLVLAVVKFDKDLPVQTPLAQQGILWLMTIIPALLLLLAMFIISKYELDDDVIDKINREIEEGRAK
ncbi:MAG: MFS transporter [Candidatus Azobacteroides sp.]|nr:MFS transporter [Candidatus Azobacteroides sp.]